MNLVKVKTKDAPLRALDWAVLKFLGRTGQVSSLALRPTTERRMPGKEAPYIQMKHGGAFVPTEDWAVVGKHIDVRWREVTQWLRENHGENWGEKIAGAVLPNLVRALVACQVEEFEVPVHFLPLPQV